MMRAAVPRAHGWPGLRDPCSVRASTSQCTSAEGQRGSRKLSDRAWHAIDSISSARQAGIHWKHGDWTLLLARPSCFAASDGCRVDKESITL